MRQVQTRQVDFWVIVIEIYLTCSVLRRPCYGMTGLYILRNIIFLKKKPSHYKPQILKSQRNLDLEHKDAKFLWIVRNIVAISQEARKRSRANFSLLLINQYCT